MKNKLTRKERKNLIRICVTLAAFLVILVTDKVVGLAGVVDGKFGWLLPFFLYFAVYIAIGYDVLFKAGRNIVHGQVLDENLLMCVASLGAFALGIYTSVTGLKQEGFDEGCAVLLFYQVGEFSKVTQRANRESRYPRLWTFAPTMPTSSVKTA